MFVCRRWRAAPLECGMPPAQELADHPANAGLRQHFEPTHLKPGLPRIATPDQVVRPYDSLGTHPDLVARLWDELPSQLPVDCRAVYCGVPALRHPQTGIVFGFAGGTHTYALRLPLTQFAAALAAGAKRIAQYPVRQPSFDLDTIGPEWVFGSWLKGEKEWCLAAYEHAATP